MFDQWFNRTHSGSSMFLIVNVAGNAYGLGADTVVALIDAPAAVSRAEATTAAQTTIYGTTTHAGQLIASVEVGNLLGLPRAGRAPNRVLVVVQAAGRTVALQVDAAVAVLEVPTSAIEAAAPGVDVDPFVSQIARIGRWSAGLLDVELIAQAAPRPNGGRR